jgi:hypothetical protein
MKMLATGIHCLDINIHGAIVMLCHHVTNLSQKLNTGREKPDNDSHSEQSSNVTTQPKVIQTY